MKTPKSLYSRLALATSVTLVVGYFVVYAAWTGILDSEIAPSATITSTLMTKIKNNLEYLSGGLANFGFSAGNVGIGIWTPTEKLDVMWNVKVSWTITRACPSWMTKIADFCIDNTSATHAAWEDQKMHMTRCLSAWKHLCSFWEVKTAWISNNAFICPGWVGRYTTSSPDYYVDVRNQLPFECSNCAANGCVWISPIATDYSEKAFCCLNP